ncbi:MAG: hypothetical protein IJV91_03525 [Kiritimatiellae bacterium]|nr:hypothetical protein [Kiritimatiellia bacterium]
MSEERKLATGFLLICGYVLLSIALAISCANSYGLGWGLAVFFCANGLFAIAVGIGALKRG